jgi:hypothetical protein
VGGNPRATGSVLSMAMIQQTGCDNQSTHFETYSITIYSLHIRLAKYIMMCACLGLSFVQ